MTEEEAKKEVKRVGRKVMDALEGEGMCQSLDALINVHRFIYEDASEGERLVIKKVLAKLQDEFEGIDKK